MNSNTKVVMGTLGAALAGAVAGVLLAPKKGTETRAMIKNKANDLTANAKQSLDKGYEKGKKSITDLTEKVKNNFKATDSNQNTGPDFQKNERYAGSSASTMSGTGSTSNLGTKPSTPGASTLGASAPSTSTPGTGTSQKNNPTSPDTGHNFGNTTK